MSPTVGGAFAGAMLIFIVITIAIVIFYIACMWKIFTKAGKEGWASLIPIYNTIVMLEIIGKPIWWIVLLFIPGVDLIISIIIMIEFGKVFGKSGAWSFFMLIIFGFIGYPILAFGDAKYQPPSGPTPQPTGGQTPGAPTGVDLSQSSPPSVVTPPQAQPPTDLNPPVASTPPVPPVPPVTPPETPASTPGA